MGPGLPVRRSKSPRHVGLGRDRAPLLPSPRTGLGASRFSAMAAETDTSRSRKGRNFSNEEEMQVCRSQLCISQDPIVGNGQRKEAFWDRVSTHYNRHWPRGLGESSARSIETKWGVIKHDVSKFCAVYGHCYDNRESGRSLDDILQAALELYKVQQARNQPFVYLHC
jgi:hypothetical protein